MQIDGLGRRLRTAGVTDGTCGEPYNFVSE